MGIDVKETLRRAKLHDCSWGFWQVVKYEERGEKMLGDVAYVQPIFITHPDGSRDYDREFHAGDIVQHFKGGLYQIVELARHTETSEELVIYKSLKDKQVWARPLWIFNSEIDQKKYPKEYFFQRYRLVKVSIDGSAE